MGFGTPPILKEYRFKPIYSHELTPEAKGVWYTVFEETDVTIDVLGIWQDNEELVNKTMSVRVIIDDLTFEGAHVFIQGEISFIFVNVWTDTLDFVETPPAPFCFYYDGHIYTPNLYGKKVKIQVRMDSDLGTNQKIITNVLYRKKEW